ncbi:hypothetical protein Ahy_A02g007346 [Arachis hypogaea]|uniref:DNA-directed RNA polymerase III subunit RPC9 n=1 Tax=Arachis hypogaea TaxID=3818 RepID=A0A445ECM3_ARAHY|nr:uncharacterized protein LOC112726881 [Arachis hypogaea]RYR73059.1 hypothetical protein Ahy_A02g007346 [Arachis hypogaea]
MNSNSDKLRQSYNELLEFKIVLQKVSLRLTDLEATLDASPFTFDTAARDQTRESINEFLESVKSHDLAKAEILNIINIRPTNIVEIFSCCDTRFSDEELTEIVEIVKRTLPPPPEDANGAEATKSNGEKGREQMETS